MTEPVTFSVTLTFDFPTLAQARDFQFYWNQLHPHDPGVQYWENHADLDDHGDYAPAPSVTIEIAVRELNLLFGEPGEVAEYVEQVTAAVRAL